MNSLCHDDGEVAERLHAKVHGEDQEVRATKPQMMHNLKVTVMQHK